MPRQNLSLPEEPLQAEGEKDQYGHHPAPEGELHRRNGRAESPSYDKVSRPDSGSSQSCKHPRCDSFFFYVLYIFYGHTRKPPHSFLFVLFRHPRSITGFLKGFSQKKYEKKSGSFFPMALG
jgi:hypothetical protein